MFRGVLRWARKQAVRYQKCYMLEQNDAMMLARIQMRAMDITDSFSALLHFTPVFAISSTIIKLTSKGSIFYRQERVGQYGFFFLFLQPPPISSPFPPGTLRD